MTTRTPLFQCDCDTLPIVCYSDDLFWRVRCPGCLESTTKFLAPLNAVDAWNGRIYERWLSDGWEVEEVSDAEFERRRQAEHDRS